MTNRGRPVKLKGEFGAILQELQKLHDKKAADYGSEDDALQNIRAASDFGIEPWISCSHRMNDKLIRIKNFIRKGELQNESLQDSLIDIAAYAVLALQLYREDYGD
jgi:hypothetical protein